MKCDLCGEPLYKGRNMKTGEIVFECLNSKCKLSILYEGIDLSEDRFNNKQELKRENLN